MDHKATRYAVANQIATITLHRPQRMNAWTGRMHTEYRYCLDLAERDHDVRAIVITGAGRGFCVGGDAAALQGHVERGAYDAGTPTALAEPGYGTAAEFDASFAYHFGLSKPVIAAINGAAAGVGLALACFADLRFAAAGVKLTTAHGKLNLPAEYGLSWLLPRMIGLTRANELLLTSRVFVAEEALAFGLLNGVHPAAELLEKTYAFARSLIATVSPNSLRQTRWQIYRDLHRDIGAAVRDSESLLTSMMRERDYAEGVAAFLAKRTPNWLGSNDD
jgi:enoyl-CoA hydratase/carnithine racemase